MNDKRPRKLLGLKDNGELVITCSSCQKQLLMLKMVIVSQEEKDIITKIKVKCAYCGSKSLDHTIHGRFYPGVVDDNMFFDISDDSSECDIYYITGIKNG